MHPRSPFLLVGLGFLAGCTPSYPDLITIDVNGGSTVIVGTDCADPCPGDGVAVTVTLDEHIAVVLDATVDFEQYKVELAVDDMDSALDYYAELVDVQVSSATPASFTINLAANSQRQALDDLLGGESANGSAMLTMAGYTPTNEILELTVEVPVLYGRYDSDEVSQ